MYCNARCFLMAFRQIASRGIVLNCTRQFKSHASTFSALNSKSSLKVDHDRQNLRFIVRLDEAGDCERAVLRYNFTGDKEVDLMSTNVPESFRGKGIAALLSKAAMEFLVEENLKAHVSCWYIKKYVEDNPLLGYKDLIIS